MFSLEIYFAPVFSTVFTDINNNNNNNYRVIKNHHVPPYPRNGVEYYANSSAATCACSVRSYRVQGWFSPLPLTYNYLERKFL